LSRWKASPKRWLFDPSSGHFRHAFRSQNPGCRVLSVRRKWPKSALHLAPCIVRIISSLRSVALFSISDFRRCLAPPQSEDGFWKCRIKPSLTGLQNARK
jgi:hypothetical protein